MVVAEVTDTNRLEIFHEGNKIVDLSREFLNSSGATKTANVKVLPDSLSDNSSVDNLKDTWEYTMSSLNVASQRGLTERFDATIGSGTVLMPYGGKRQMTPAQAMAALIPVRDGNTTTCSVMAYGYDPFLAAQSPYYGAYMAVVSSVAKIIAAGGDIKNTWLSFQEYFERLRKDEVRWGKPFSALLGAFEAQLQLKLGAIGGKDSMSGSFEDIDVPPTLISFAASCSNADNIISPEFKKAGTNLYLIEPQKAENGLFVEIGRAHV